MTKKIEQQLEDAVATGDILGLSLALIQEGRVVFARGYGLTTADETAVPVNTDTLFAYGSISKVICATMIMRLVERGALDLDRPLGAYLPRLSFSNEAYVKQLTLRHVLSHTTGLPAAGRYYGPRGEKALQQVVEAEVTHYPFLAAPSELHLYANTVFCIAGYAAEVVTGQPYDDLVHELVLKPLQMAVTTFNPPPPSSGRVALPHMVDGVTLRTVSRLPANDAGHPSSFVYGTAIDLAQLAIAHLEQGQFRGRHFLSPQTLAEMHGEHTSCHIAGASSPLAYISGGYGLGIQTGDYVGHRVLRHGGMTLSYNCFFDLLPESRSGFVLLTNAGKEAPLMEIVAFLYDWFLGLPHRGIVPLKEPALFDAPEERQKWPLYEGTYLNVEWGRLVEVRVEGDALLLVHDGEARPLTPIASGRYYAVTESGARQPLAFLARNTESAQHIVLARMPYHRYTVEQVASENAVWLTFAGSYCDPFSTNDEETLHLRYKNSHLWLREGNGEEIPCQPLGGRTFRCDLGFFELELDGVDATRCWCGARRRAIGASDEEAANQALRLVMAC